MHVVAIHTISDPDGFFRAIEAAPLPQGMALHATLPNADSSRMVCLWEADSLESVEQLVNTTVGEYSDNEFFAVRPDAAQGLPVLTA
jgi:hypothetical protein